MARQENKRPLFVDLDGSLVKTDTLWESIALLLRAKPIALLLLPLWVLKGKREFKRRIADIRRPDPSLLPYNEELLNYLKEESTKRKLYLVSAADQRIVSSIADHLGIFEDAIGTNASRNLRSEIKLEAIKQIAGNAEFEYVGNENADIPIWKESAIVHITSSSSSYFKKIKKIVPAETRNYKIDLPMSDYFKAIRPHQWMKNVLVFAPFVLAHKPVTVSEVTTLLLAFICFSFCASSVYVFNDILDIEPDRKHPDKKHRPFAIASIPIRNGIFLAAGLMIVSLVLSTALMPEDFTIIMVGYLILTTLYTVHLKKLLLIDIICLSSFYTIRVLAGGQASEVEISLWFLAFSSCFFLSLSYAKRYIELINTTDSRNKSLNDRGYQAIDANIVLSSGIACGFLSVLVFFLYIANSEVVNELYKSPTYLWFVGPILTYWISRIWILAQRKEVHSDPVLFAVKDLNSWLAGIAILTTVVLGAVL